MKKVVLALAVIATVAMFGSCKKTCTCKTYLAGELQSTTEDVELSGDYKKCADMNTIITIDGNKTGMECE